MYGNALVLKCAGGKPKRSVGPISLYDVLWGDVEGLGRECKPLGGMRAVPHLVAGYHDAKLLERGHGELNVWS